MEFPWLQNPERAPLSIFASNEIMVTWTICWWVHLHTPPSHTAPGGPRPTATLSATTAAAADPPSACITLLDRRWVVNYMPGGWVASLQQHWYIKVGHHRLVCGGSCPHGQT